MPAKNGLPPSRRSLVVRFERRMERETGIEPATNSLEGCDSTTELLPPARCPLRSTLRRASPRAFDSLPPPDTLRPTSDGWPANRNPPPLKAPAAKVGGEGRVRTSVARRRQVYSLLRLTALPPPRNTSRFSRCLPEHLRGVPFFVYCSFGIRVVSMKRRRHRPVELAEGFEPPTG